MSGVSNGVAGRVGGAAWDVCIIGGGAAGLVLAEFLTREGAARVCIIEAGPLAMKDRAEPYVVKSLDKQHVGANEGRVTVFGGATNTWGGGLMRQSPSDFEALTGEPETGWPISYGEMIRHYEGVERLFGFTPAPEGPANVVIDGPSVRVRRREIPVLPFRSKNFAKRFGPGLMARPNVEVISNAHIEKFDVRGGALRGVEVSVKGGARRRIDAGRYVLAAGYINTNLLVRRVARECGLDLPETGRCLHDHLSFPFALLKPRSQRAFSLKFGYRFERGIMIGEHFDAETVGVRLPGAFMHLVFDTSGSSILRPVRKVLQAVQERRFDRTKRPTLGELGPMLAGLPRLGLMRYTRGRLFLDAGTRVYATLDIEQRPRSEWTVGPGSDGLGCEVNWGVSRNDAELALRYLGVCREVLARLKHEADFDAEDVLPARSDDVEVMRRHLHARAEDTYHTAGGVRMGTDGGAIVDTELRLRGVANLHVLSSAVFPRIGTSNPTHTILALGHRLAEGLLSRRFDGP